MKYCTILYLSKSIALVSVFCNAEQKAVNGGIVDGVRNEHFSQETPVELVQSIRPGGRTLNNKATTKATKQPKNNAKATKTPKNSKNPGTPSPTSTASLAPTGVPSGTPPSVLPTMSPTTSPSASPTMSPSTEPTITASPTGVPTMVPSSSPSVLPTMSPTTGPSTTPTISPSTVHTLTPSSVPTKKTATNTPTTRPFSAPSTCIDDESIFKSIKDDVGVQQIDFYYDGTNDDYGYIDDYDDKTDEIAGIDDFRLEENGRMSFFLPWGCTPDETLFPDPACRKATLEIFEQGSVNPLEGNNKVFVKLDTNDNSVIVSWEGVQGKTEQDGNVNVQAQLFPDGNIRVCFGCGSLPVDLEMSMRFDSDEAIYYDDYFNYDGSNEDVFFGPADNTVYPENECFDVPLDQVQSS